MGFIKALFGNLFMAISNETISGITSGLDSFGTTLLEYIVQLLPALAGLGGILMVIHIIRKKIRA